MFHFHILWIFWRQVPICKMSIACKEYEIKIKQKNDGSHQNIFDISILISLCVVARVLLLWWGAGLNWSEKWEWWPGRAREWVKLGSQPSSSPTIISRNIIIETMGDNFIHYYFFNHLLLVTIAILLPLQSPLSSSQQLIFQ